MKAYSDKHLLKLWRQAVLKNNKGQCFLCGNMNIDELECHHIVKRRHKILRYEVWNGIPVCRYTCHNQIDSLKGRRELRDAFPERFDMLEKYENMTLKEYLFKNELTENEFLVIRSNELKEIIKGDV